MSNLTRERVLDEIIRLDHEIGDLGERIEPHRKGLSAELQTKIAELESSIVAARQISTSNEMDFRQIELGLMQLRARRAEVLSSLKRLKIQC
jgi:hypothetical protein